MRLSSLDFKRAESYLMQRARPLERALFRYYFYGEGYAEAVDALAAHQSATGGFCGMGEGPNDVASPIGTSIAFQHVVDLGLGVDSPLVQRGVAYILNSYDYNYHAWPQVADEQEYLDTELPRHWGNPGAELVGYLWRYRELVDSAFLDEVTALAMRRFREVGRGSDFDDLCFLRCAAHIDARYAEEITAAVAASRVEKARHAEYDTWHNSYFVKPYWYAPHPTAPLYLGIQDSVNRCLDFDIQTQEPDGSVFLTFAVEVEERIIWKSIWTLESLRMLKAYRRIEGVV